MSRFRVLLVVASTLTLAPMFQTASGDTVQSVVDSVSTSSYQSYQLAIQEMGDGSGNRNRDWDFPNGVGKPGNLAAQAYIGNAFGAMGLTTATQGPYQNIVGELPGTTTPENIYIIGAHLDHIDGNSPGGDDNASGTAGILEAARVLSQYQFESTVRFVGFNAEEDGLLGSSDYVVNQVIANSEYVVGMVNLDMILRPGWDSNPAAVIDLDLGTSTNPNSRAWAGEFQQAAVDYVPSLSVDATIFDLGARSDHYTFDLLGYPAFTAIENTDTELPGANSYYHTSEDSSDGLAGVLYDYDFASDVVRASVGLIAQEATLVPEPSTWVMLFTAGLAALGLLRRRSSKQW